MKFSDTKYCNTNPRLAKAGSILTTDVCSYCNNFTRRTKTNTNHLHNRSSRIFYYAVKPFVLPSSERLTRRYGGSMFE